MTSDGGRDGAMPAHCFPATRIAYYVHRFSRLCRGSQHGHGRVRKEVITPMHITARADYAIRALVALAAAADATATGPQLAASQAIPAKFLESILRDLKREGMVLAHRGRYGGYGLARPASEILLADVVRAVDGPLAAVRGLPPERLEYTGAAQRLTDVWVAVRVALRGVLESVSIEDLVTGSLPESVTALLSAEGAWQRR